MKKQFTNLALTSLLLFMVMSVKANPPTEPVSCGTGTTTVVSGYPIIGDCLGAPSYHCSFCNWAAWDKKWNIVYGNGASDSATVEAFGDCYNVVLFGLNKCTPQFQDPYFTYETLSYGVVITYWNEILRNASYYDSTGCVVDGTPHLTQKSQSCDPYDGIAAGTCNGAADYTTYPTTGCMTGFINNGGTCDRTNAFKSRCNDPTGYDPAGCDCPDGQSFSPIIVDIDHSGFSMTDAAGGVVFNILKDNVPLAISWTAGTSTNAFIVLDRNGNGRIDSGEELFGDLTPQPASAAPNGFLALAEYDKTGNGGNGNGRIDSGDAIFAQLRLWQDVNHNGASEPNELRPLPALGIGAIGLDYKESKWTDQYGNKFRYRAKVYDVNGAQAGRWAWDVFLVLQ
jgi:hypothetical protein